MIVLFFLQSGVSNRPFYSCLLSVRPLNGSEAGDHLVLIQTSLLCCINQVVMLISLQLNDKCRDVCIKAWSPPALLAFIGQVTEHKNKEAAWPSG